MYSVHNTLVVIAGQLLTLGRGGGVLLLCTIGIAFVRRRGRLSLSLFVHSLGNSCACAGPGSLVLHPVAPRAIPIHSSWASDSSCSGFSSRARHGPKTDARSRAPRAPRAWPTIALGYLLPYVGAVKGTSYLVPRGLLGPSLSCPSTVHARAWRGRPWSRQRWLAPSRLCQRRGRRL